MLHRRSTATALVAVMLPVAALLSSCGFDLPTDKINTIAAGSNNRDASVDVLGARVIAYEDGFGRLIATLVNNEAGGDDDAVTLDTVEGPTAAVELPEVAVRGHRQVNLAASEQAAVVTGEFVPGQVITLNFSFSTGEVVSLDVPVVKNCGQYLQVDEPSAAPDPDAEEPGEDQTGQDDTTDDTTDDTETTDEDGAEADAAYACEHPTEQADEH